MKHIYSNLSDDAKRRKKEVARQIGRVFRDKRIARQLTQSEAGRRVGLSHAAINYIESGRNMPKLMTFLDLCYFYRVSPNTVLVGKI